MSRRLNLSASSAFASAELETDETPNIPDHTLLGERQGSMAVVTLSDHLYRSLIEIDV
jgi:hypothetical protein